MSYYIRALRDLPLEVWKIDDEEALRLGITNARGGAGTISGVTACAITAAVSGTVSVTVICGGLGPAAGTHGGGPFSVPARVWVVWRVRTSCQCAWWRSFLGVRLLGHGLGPATGTHSALLSLGV